MLQKIIHQLKEEDYSLLQLQMKESKAGKCSALLTNYRNDKYTDQELIALLKVKPTAFFTLKSRLSKKVHYLLYRSTSETRTELAQNIAKINHLIYNTPRETSIQILKKIEEQLIKYDMPNELTILYKALKKLHRHTPKYWDYSKLYNKHVSYNLWHDKAEDFLSSFCGILSRYYLNRNEQEITKLFLLKKEMENVCKLYESHRLKVYKNILNIHFALFLSDVVQMDDDTSIEPILEESLEIVNAFAEDKEYKYLVHVINYLHFEFFHQQKEYKNACIFHDKIVDKTNLLLLLDHSCFASHFFISKIKYTVENLKRSDRGSQNHISEDDLNIENSANFILFNHYKAALAFYEYRYSDAIQILNKLLRETSFKENPFSEIETKLFLAMLYFFNNNKEHASLILRNTIRKINKENENERFHQAFHFIKLLRSMGKKRGLRTDKNNVILNQDFAIANSGKYGILKFLLVDDSSMLPIKPSEKKNKFYSN